MIRWSIPGVGVLLCVVGLWMRGTSIVDASVPPDENRRVLELASEITGLGYCALSDTGVTKDIVYEGDVILRRSKSGGSYCCGFTFQVAMDVLTERGLLEGRKYDEVKRFQKQWYGSEPGSEQRQVVQAMEFLRVGREVPLNQARAGDFMVFSGRSYGHSVILLDTIRRDGEVIGIYYRSSQRSTGGVGNQTGYFRDSGYSNGTIDRSTVRIGRLFPGK